MAEPQFPDPAKLFIAVLYSTQESLERAIDFLTREWGAIDFEGCDHPFDATSYYEPEMGDELKRRLIAFERLAPPESIRQAKLICNRIENELRSDRGRTVNLDVGMLDHNKIVLASCKGAGQKIHLGDGVYADLVARYASGRYRPFEWTFPDFKDGRYDSELDSVRRMYLQQLRST